MWVTKKQTLSRVALFIFPSMVILVLFSILPLIFSIRLALINWTIATRLSPSFVGLANFKKVILDWRFWSAIKTTLLIMICAVSLEFVIGLGIALLLNKSYVKGKVVFRTIVLIPMMIAPMVIGYLFRLIFHPTAGPLNFLLGLLGIPFLQWEADPQLAFFAVMITDVWEWAPFIGLILLAGLQGVPDELREAAKIDGASELQIFRYIVFPLLIPVSIIAVLLRVIDCMRLFDVPYILTHGGPGTATEVMTLYIYLRGFKAFDLSIAAAMSWLLLILSILIAQFFLKMLSKRGRF